MAENLLMGPHAMALSWKINGVKSSPLIFGKGPQLYAQKTVTRNLLMLQMLLWCGALRLIHLAFFYHPNITILTNFALIRNQTS